MCKTREASQPVSCECQLCLVYSIEFNIMLYYNKISSLFLIVIQPLNNREEHYCLFFLLYTDSIETSLYQFLVIQAI